MGLDPELVRELVAAENDRRELRTLRCDSVPVERTRAAIADALARDPELRIADIAAGWRCTRPTLSERFSVRAETAGPSAASPLRTRVV